MAVLDLISEAVVLDRVRQLVRVCRAVLVYCQGVKRPELWSFRNHAAALEHFQNEKQVKLDIMSHQQHLAVTVKHIAEDPAGFAVVDPFICQHVVGDMSQLDDLLRYLFALRQLAKSVDFELYAVFGYESSSQLDDLILFRIEAGCLSTIFLNCCNNFLTLEHLLRNE